jgi:hypothetical protein
MIKRTAIKINPFCKCGCGKIKTNGCRGYNFNCLPKLEKEEKISKRLISKRRAAKKALFKKKVWLVQKEVGLPVGLKIRTKAIRKPISKVSKRRLAELKVYSVLKKDFLLDNPNCACGRSGCKRKAVDVHHSKGRIGSLLNEVKFWIPVSRICHRWIEENPTEAKELGLSVSRLSKTSVTLC